MIAAKTKTERQLQTSNSKPDDTRPNTAPAPAIPAQVATPRVRSSSGKVLVMVANCSSTPVTVPDGGLPDVRDAQLLLSTHGDRRGPDLEPWESRLLLMPARPTLPRSGATARASTGPQRR